MGCPRPRAASTAGAHGAQPCAACSSSSESPCRRLLPAHRLTKQLMSLWSFLSWLQRCPSPEAVSAEAGGEPCCSPPAVSCLPGRRRDLPMLRTCLQRRLLPPTGTASDDDGRCD